jgi:hypothetical protein
MGPLALIGLVPRVLKEEHDELHAELARLAREPGQIGVAANAVATLLHAHFLSEEQIAIPPLALLPMLAAGKMPDEPARVIEMSGRLKAELPRMLEEHIAIVAAVRVLMDQANEVGRYDVADFAQKLIHHAETEEDVLYPAAILVGEYLLARLASR